MLPALNASREGPWECREPPLMPLPVVGIPFECISMDLIGPLKRSQTRNRFILVIVDYVTRYPEAGPLCSAPALNIAMELVKIFTQVGIPKEILMDQGTNVSSKLIAEMCQFKNIQTLRTSVCHP